MRVDFASLRAELTLWRAQRKSFPLWWRDDDAVAPTAALDRLAVLSHETGVPVHLAIIPSEATPELAPALDDSFVPVVHGWAHANNAPEGQKKAEFGPGRPQAEVESDLKAGLARMEDLFGARLARMFVPPWNRLDNGALPLLQSLGYESVSTYLPRKSADAAPGLEQINTHIDPIFWRGTRGLVPPEAILEQTVALLRDRREGRSDNAEPLGYLTHHLVHDADIWEFSRQFILELCEGPVTLFRQDGKDRT